MPEEINLHHHGQLLHTQLKEAGLSGEIVAKELRIQPEELSLLFTHAEIKSSVMVRVLGAIEIVRLKINKEY